MTQPKYLPEDPQQAVETMLRITEEMIARIEIETNAVAINDGTTFTMNEQNKETVIDVYQQAANEFHERVNEFRNVDKTLIEKLDMAQKSLGESTKTNLALLEKIQPQEGE